jgi:6-phosphogluconolactonase
MTELRVYPDPEATAQAATLLLAEEIERAREQRGAVHVALAGGSTPERTYELLAEDGGLDWTRVELWMGDERVVPDDHPDSNLRMCREALGGLRGLGEEQWRRVPTELGPQGAADAYGAELESRAPTDGGRFPVLDVALQGIGPDGHTASLFPHHPVLQVDDVTCAAVLDSPKPPPERVTMTLPVLRAARSIVFLVTGEQKAGPVAQIMAGPDPGTPSSLLGGDATIVLCDEAAASQTAGRDG